jgi:hypothetical protein
MHQEQDMSNLRQAAQRALKAMEDGEYRADMIEFSDALVALRQALAEPESDYERGFVDGMQEQMKRSVDKAVNRMAQTTHWEGCDAVHPECRKPEQEPVAWELRMGKTDRVLIEITNNPKRAQDWRASLCEVVPLYYAPTPRKPLTDDEIAQAMFRAHAIVTGPMQFRFAREIERAHGIVEQKEKEWK